MLSRSSGRPSSGRKPPETETPAASCGPGALQKQAAISNFVILNDDAEARVIMKPAIETALQEWAEILPSEAVLTGDSLAHYHLNCLSLTRKIHAALQPRSEADVIQIVRIANRYRIPLYTVSTGHNWGYGSALPVRDDCVIVDLSRMNW